MELNKVLLNSVGLNSVGLNVVGGVATGGGEKYSQLVSNDGYDLVSADGYTLFGGFSKQSHVPYDDKNGDKYITTEGLEYNVRIN